MAVNKVVINDEVVLDLTGDTVQAADLPKGVIAHSATGPKSPEPQTMPVPATQAAPQRAPKN